MGIQFLGRKLRAPICAIYGFVRLADEIVDSFNGYNQQHLLQKFANDTWESIEEGISVNPILNSFQQVVWEYGIDKELIATFLDSMKMDLVKQQYTNEKYEQYILGSAEVVGLMCLHIFTERDRKLYEELKPYAMKLGAAFQKVNFLRDLKDDYRLLGRTYFPSVNLEHFSCTSKKEIEREIENDFKIALKGIRRLPNSSKAGVYLAYVYYQSLFNKIKRLSPQRILNGRVRINNGIKLGLMVNSLIEYKMRRI
jgi:phytoene/squalene synthetase